MNWVSLVCIMGSSVGKDQRERKVERVINDRSASVSGFSHVGHRDLVYSFEGFKTGVQGIAVRLTFGMGEPEKDGVNEHGRSVGQLMNR